MNYNTDVCMHLSEYRKQLLLRHTKTTQKGLQEIKICFSICLQISDKFQSRKLLFVHLFVKPHFRVR
jgi:hypothetical protein